MDANGLHPVNRALTRHHLVLGGERELVSVSLLLTAAVVMYIFSQYFNLIAIALVVALESCLLFIFREMAKRDPNMSRVYLRHLTYRNVYPSRTIPSVTDR